MKNKKKGEPFSKMHFAKMLSYLKDGRQECRDVEKRMSRKESHKTRLNHLYQIKSKAVNQYTNQYTNRVTIPTKQIVPI